MKDFKDIVYVGVDDTELDLFEGQYKVPDGMSYNSYVILDKKIAVMDAVDKSCIARWLDNIALALQGRPASLARRLSGRTPATPRYSICSATFTAWSSPIKSS